MTIGNIIKIYRKKLNLTQEELAKKSGLSRNAIYNYENEKRSPDIKTVKRIAEALGVKFSELIGGDSYIVNISRISGSERDFYTQNFEQHEDFEKTVNLLENMEYEIKVLISPEAVKIEIDKDDKCIASISLKDFIQLGRNIQIILDNLNRSSETIIENLIEQYSIDSEKWFSY